MNKINKKQLECILEAIDENTDYEIEINGYHDYDVLPCISKDRMVKLLKEINKIINKEWIKNESRCNKR